MLRLPPFDKIGATPVPDCVNADPTNGIPGSILNMLMFNILQHEGENLALAAGLTPSGTDLTQWMQAVSRGGVWAGALTGTGDLAVATLPVVLPALLQGMRVGAVATNANTTTAPKLRLTNYGSQGLQQDFPILKADGSALAAGDIVSGRIYRFEADGAGNVLISGGGLGSGLSSSINVGIPRNDPWIRATAGTYSWTCPTGVTRVRARVWGGGGGGGGSTSGAGSFGSGAGGAGYAEGIYTVVPGTTYPVIVGAGGAGGASGGGNGTSGGSSSFGSFCSATGGGNGIGGSGAPQVNTGAGGSGSGGNFFNRGGQQGGSAYLVGGGSYVLGVGAPSYLGIFAPGINTAVAANGPNGVNFGDGGSGGGLGGAGGAGHDGATILEF